jgi:archaellum component FlaF (FlaF/FlaG flagellin family)
MLLVMPFSGCISEEPITPTVSNTTNVSEDPNTIDVAVNLTADMNTTEENVSDIDVFINGTQVV